MTRIVRQKNVLVWPLLAEAILLTGYTAAVVFTTILLTRHGCSSIGGHAVWVTGKHAPDQLIKNGGICDRKVFVTYVDMVADLFHFGHANFLRQCREHCEEQARELNRPNGCYLLVGIHSDEDVESYKRTPVLSMDERVLSMEGSRYVTKVVPNAPLVADRDFLEANCIDALMHGDDNEDTVIYAAAMDMGIFRSVPYTEGISTTELVKRVQKAQLKKKGKEQI